MPVSPDVFAAILVLGDIFKLLLISNAVGVIVQEDILIAVSVEVDRVGLYSLVASHVHLLGIRVLAIWLDDSFLVDPHL